MNKDGVIQFKGQEYSLAVNFNVIEKIQDEYGSYSEWAEKLLDDAEPNAKAIKFGFWVMINEWVDIQREAGNDIEPLDLKDIGRLVTEIGFSRVTTLMRTQTVEAVGETPKN